MKLSILIPTYNRSNFLINNLEKLSTILAELSFHDNVSIIISDNNSPDNTEFEVRNFMNNNPLISIHYYRQTENIGLEKNVLYVLGKAKSEFIMFLGDDDLISKNYLQKVMEYLSTEENLRAIIPNFYSIDIHGNKISEGRDDGIKTQLFPPGFSNCMENSWRAHQMSGLIFQREGLYESYKSNGVNNIYPFIYFASISSLYGKTLLLTDYPIQVCQPGRDKKFWSYGNDMLLNDVFDNYDKLDINSIKKTRLQTKLLSKQYWRWSASLQNGLGNYVKKLCVVWMIPNSTYIYKIFFPIIFLRLKLLARLKSKSNSQN